MVLAWGKVVEAAEALGVNPCCIMAVASNESGGKGFDASGRVLVRFEKHVFRRELRKRGVAQAVMQSAEKLSGVRWDTLNVATVLHEEASLCATSFGMFQIMGFNYAAAGFATVMDFVTAQQEGTEQQLESFCAFIRQTGLVPLMRQRDFKGFARRYNGPAYADNRYDIKLEKAYENCLKKTHGKGKEMGDNFRLEVL